VTVVAAIFARGGSKGVPRKNLRLLAGRPLIAHSIDVARACPGIDRVIVSTDDAEIAEVARAHGADVPFVRPAELARDDSPEWLAWQHALRALAAAGEAASLLVTVPTTAPLRAVEDVEACLRAVRDSEADCAITVTPAQRSPYFNMVRLDAAGYAELVIRPEQEISRRQDAPAVFDMTTVAYAARPEFVLRARSLFEGRVRAVVVPRERAVDIDDELDLAFAEFLIQRRR
jgi:N-acylneuraminate cytidylyltransferase